MELPEAFVKHTQALLGKEYPAFVAALNENSPVGIRLNRTKESTLPDNATNIPWCDSGFYLESRPSFTFDPLFHAGCYYVQEASSMFLEQVIRSNVKKSVTCLDLCAAPGGKSTHLSSMLPDGSLLVSNEVIRSRAHVLAENNIKWGNPSVVVTNNDPSDIGKLTHFFDVILTDVPCSGEGMFRKDPEAIKEWSPANVNLCAERQRRIIADIWPALKPGGILIYSTCTYNTLENEENILWIMNELGGEALSVAHDPSWGIKDGLKGEIPAYRFMPHRTKGEGFFIAAVRKKENDIENKTDRRNLIRTTRNSEKKQGKSQVIKIPQEIYSWITDPEDYYFRINNETISAIPLKHQEMYEVLKDHLKIVHAGVTLGTIKGKDIVPDHSLSVSKTLNWSIFPKLEVDKLTAINYLRKEALFNLPESCPKGYNIITFEGHPLGFIKNIGNRANNLYPQEWRIRKSI